MNDTPASQTAPGSPNAPRPKPPRDEAAMPGASPGAPPRSSASSGAVAEMLSDGFGLDWAVPRTFEALLRDPGRVAREYHRRRTARQETRASGQEVPLPSRRFVPPYRYIVLTAALFTFLSALLFDMGEVLRQAQEAGLGLGTFLTGEDPGAASMSDFSETERAFFDKGREVATLMSTRYLAVTYLCLLLPPMAFFTTLLHKAPADDFRETFKRHFALNTYLWGEALVLLAVPLLVLAVTGNYTLYTVLTLPVYAVYVVWGQMRFFGLRGWKGTVQAGVAFGLGYLTYTLLLGVAMWAIAALLFFL